MNYSDRQLIKDIAGFVRPYRQRFWVGTFLRVTSDLVWLFPIWAVSELITFATHHRAGDPLTYFWVLMGAMVVAGLYHYPTHDLAKYHIYQVAERIGIDARLLTLRHLFRLDTLWHEKESSGNKIRRLNTGGDGLMRILRLYVDLVIESSINLVAISIIFFRIRPELAAILLVFFFTYFMLSLYLTKRASGQSYRTNVQWEAMDGMAFEAVSNIATVKALQLGENLLRYLQRRADELMTFIRKRIALFRFRGGFLNTYQELFRQLMIFYTVWQVFQGNLEVGTIALVLLYFGKIRESAGELAEVSNEWVIAKIAILRMRDVLNEKPTIEAGGTRQFSKNWRTLSIRDLSFSYDGHGALNHFSLNVQKGERVGVVGISGEGKSTLFKLLLKLYENYEGTIAFNGTDLRDIRAESYRRHIAVVPQETELFNLSLRENITLSPRLTAAQKKRFERALRIAHVQDFMHKLPQGVESMIGEKGVKLSGGEKQRVGIARAVYRHPQLLLLDEATSHLDVESEKKIQEALHYFFQETTAIVIAHRLSTIREMDRIVVLHRGQVAEEGSFENLLARKGKFYQLWESQKF